MKEKEIYTTFVHTRDELLSGNIGGRENDVYQHLRGPLKEQPTECDFRIKPHAKILRSHWIEEVHLVEQLQRTDGHLQWIPVRTDPARINDPFRGRSNH